MVDPPCGTRGLGGEHSCAELERTYVADAEQAGDSELADFFRPAQGESRLNG
jgi:hypothetical protein